MYDMPNFYQGEKFVEKLSSFDNTELQATKQITKEVNKTLRDTDSEIEKIKGRLYAMAFSNVDKTSENILHLVSELEKNQSMMKKCIDMTTVLHNRIENSTYIITSKEIDGVG